MAMKTRLKQFRVAANLTQAKVAAAVGIAQPNYHRWEVGTAPIPEAKLKKLAKVLKTTPEALLGKHPPIRAGLYDDSVSDELSYYGEVAIHFCGGGQPLLLSISESEFARLHRDMQGDGAFVTVQSLANQTVVIRTKAVSDLYFSSEAYDDYGPEHGAYAGHIDVQIPDPRDWEIVESLAFDRIGEEDFAPEDIERVRRMIMITDEQYKELVTAGDVKAEELEGERAKNQAETDMIMSAATKTTYQLSADGKKRSITTFDSKSLFDAFYELIDFDGGLSPDGMIRWAAEGYHRTIFINKQALDYIVIPTHKFEEGRVETTADELEGNEP
jgi:transcriptional regulator with XRE-family HTH domain